MKDERATVPESTTKRARSAQLRERIVRFRRREPLLLNGIRLGTPEIIGLSVAALLSLVAVIAYFNYLAPARARLAALQSDYAQLQARLRGATEGVQRGENSEASIAEILQSLNDFETNHLPARGEGQTVVIEELNNLIRRNSLRISGSATFASLDPVQSGSNTRPRTGSAAGAPSVFPGVGITLTVEGAYGNLRRFVHDIESSRQFIVISSVELQGMTEGTSGARTNAALVSLRLNMAAYFRRDIATQTTSSDNSVSSVN